MSLTTTTSRNEPGVVRLRDGQLERDAELKQDSTNWTRAVSRPPQRSLSYACDGARRTQTDPESHDTPKTDWKISARLRFSMSRLQTASLGVKSLASSSALAPDRPRIVFAFAVIAMLALAKALVCRPKQIKTRSQILLRSVKPPERTKFPKTSEYVLSRLNISIHRSSDDSDVTFLFRANHALIRLTSPPRECNFRHRSLVSEMRNQRVASVAFFRARMQTSKGLRERRQNAKNLFPLIAHLFAMFGR